MPSVEVLRDRNALYRERADGLIENVYNVKILNKDDVAHDFTIAATGLPGLRIDYGAATIHVGPGEVGSVPVRLRVPRASLRGSADIGVTIRTAGERAREAHGKARFLAPAT